MVRAATLAPAREITRMSPSPRRIERALISVSDKTGLIDFARTLAAAGVEIRIEEDPSRFRPLDLPLLCGDATRIAQLGWRPRRGLDAAVADLWHEVRSAGTAA